MKTQHFSETMDLKKHSVRRLENGKLFSWGKSPELYYTPFIKKHGAKGEIYESVSSLPIEEKIKIVSNCAFSCAIMNEEPHRLVWKTRDAWINEYTDIFKKSLNIK